MKRKDNTSTLTRRGQTSVPARIRHQMGWKTGTHLAWVASDNGARVIPVPADPVRALRGILKGAGLTELLLKERQRDKARE